MKKLLLRLLHYVIYVSLFMHKFASVSPSSSLTPFQIYLDYLLATFRLFVLRIVFLYDDRAVIKGCLDGKMDNAKKLDHVAIVINNLVSSKQVAVSAQVGDEVSSGLQTQHKQIC